LNINPHRRKVFCDIGSVSPNYTLANNPHLQDVPGNHNRDNLRFILAQTLYPYAQPSCFVSGTYGIKILLYSENARRQEVYFKITWSGRWHDTQEAMFREIVIQQVRSI
jgi:hypothetical protein